MSKINKVDRKNEISTSEKKPENKGSTPNRNLPKKSTDIKKPENSELKLPESQTAVTKSVDIPVNLKKKLVIYYLLIIPMMMYLVVQTL